MTPNGLRFECQMEMYMPIALALIGLAQSIYQDRHGVSNTGLSSFANALNAVESFGSLYNRTSDFSNVMSDSGVRRNYL